MPQKGLQKAKFFGGKMVATVTAVHPVSIQVETHPTSGQDLGLAILKEYLDHCRYLAGGQGRYQAGIGFPRQAHFIAALGQEHQRHHQVPGLPAYLLAKETGLWAQVPKAEDGQIRGSHTQTIFGPL